MPPPPRARIALNAMKSIGFSTKEAAPILRKLLEVYKNWKYIEDNGYKVLIDSILEAQSAKASTTKQNAVAGDDPEHSKKRIRKLSENPSISTLATDSSGEILLKKQKLEADVSPEEQLGGIIADPVPLQVADTGRIDVASSQFGNRQKMTEPTSAEPSFSSEKAEQDLSPVNRRETGASSRAQKTSSLHENAEHLMHGRDKMSASERSRNSIDLKKPKTDPGSPTPATEELRAETPPPEQPTALVLSPAASSKSPATLLPSSATSGALVSSSVTSLSPVDVPDLLGIFIGQLESVMRKTVEIVSAGRGTFESFRPFLTNSLNSVRCLGDAQCIERCSKGISHLEADLKALHGFERVDLVALIESTFSNIQAEAARRQEVIQKSLAEREARIRSLQDQRDQVQTELTTSTTAMQTTRGAIAQLKADLAQKEAQLVREEALVKGLTLKIVGFCKNYCKEVQIIEETKKEVIAAVPNKDELRRKATMMVRAVHEKKLSDIKSRLASIKLMGSQT